MAGGVLARQTGSDFEHEIAASFEAYRAAGLVHLAMMPVPMTPCGVRHPKTRAPLYLPRGKAPFDVYGWWLADGRFIGAEIKASVRKPSLPIVLPDRTGDGIRFHQLEALRDLAEAGGIARIVWNNGGEVGVLREEKIINAWSAAWTAWRVERDPARRAAPGSKSIKWEIFQPVDYATLGGIVCLPWLRHEQSGDVPIRDAPIAAGGGGGYAQ